MLLATPWTAWPRPPVPWPAGLWPPRSRPEECDWSQRNLLLAAAAWPCWPRAGVHFVSLPRAGRAGTPGRSLLAERRWHSRAPASGDRPAAVAGARRDRHPDATLVRYMARYR